MRKDLAHRAFLRKFKEPASLFLGEVAFKIYNPMEMIDHRRAIGRRCFFVPQFNLDWAEFPVMTLNVYAQRDRCARTEGGQQIFIRRWACILATTPARPPRNTGDLQLPSVKTVRCRFQPPYQDFLFRPHQPAARFTGSEM
jgi:hypothetical protein